MRVMLHNIWVGQHGQHARDNVERAIEDCRHPQIVKLQEAHGFHGTLKGYERVAPVGSPDDENCVMLVRTDLRIASRHFVRPGGPDWEGPKHDKMHPPHIFPGATVFNPEDDKYWVFLNVHRLSARPKNPEAAQHEMNALTRWANRRAPHRPLAMGGDWNGRHVDEDLRQFVKQTKTEFNLRGIDGEITRNIEVTKLKELRGLYGSDAHQPILLEMRAR